MPPGRTTENWSRRDGIRAGSVSGPWRSTPREAGRAPAADPRPAPAPVVRRRDRRSSLLPLGGWIAVGVVAAAAIVLAAVRMQPPSPQAPAPAEVAAELPAPAPPAAEVADAAAAAPAAVDPALAGVSTVLLRIGPESPAGREAALLDALRAAGITGVRVDKVAFRVASSRVGYYRADDLAAAEALGRLVSPVLSETIGVRDYGKLLADAAPGRLDLWIEG
jgi:hypothetical protein